METTSGISLFLVSSLSIALLYQPMQVCAAIEITDQDENKIKINDMLQKQEIEVYSSLNQSDTDCNYDYDVMFINERFQHIESQYIDLITRLDDCDDKLSWYLEYKDFLYQYSDEDIPESIYDYYSEEEIYYMQRVVETETYGADFVSKTHVASVILNRIDSDVFPNDPISVVTAQNQFAYFRTNISQETILALEYVFEIEDTTCGAVYFHSNSYSPTFNRAEYSFTDAVGHHFYVNK